MAQIKWENVPDSEVRAEVEAVLESQGEAKRIREFLHKHHDMEKWREEVKQLCREEINARGERGMDKLTPDILFDQVAAKAREKIPAGVTEEMKQKLVQFLQTQFEDHI